MTNILENINIVEVVSKVGSFAREFVEEQINYINDRENWNDWAERSQARVIDGLYYVIQLYQNTMNTISDDKLQYYYKNPEIAIEAFILKLQDIIENPVTSLEEYSNIAAGTLGFMLGYNIPNLKISMLGLSKQSLITHSILPVIAMKRLMDLTLRDDEVFDFSPVEELVRADIIKAVKYFGANPFFIGYTFGVGVHLMLDVIRSNDGIVLTGLPTTILPGGRLIDRAWLLGSALACFSLGKEYINGCQGQDNEIMTLNDIAQLLEKKAC